MKDIKLNDIYVVVGIALDGHKEITTMVNGEAELSTSIEKAHSCGKYLFVTYYNMTKLIEVYVKQEDVNDFLFYYGIAEAYWLEIEYLQLILNGFTPAGAANEWDL